MWSTWSLLVGVAVVETTITVAALAAEALAAYLLVLRALFLVLLSL
jgi:hypothetical protein